ncbi:MAG: bifunctional methylenetetrahydrofolate dehydrogenase/methenyltetrahydrofolate cyclohydrolase FolD [Clostridia bacterium]|nr:bifunctional methylenetetrahydrofolate dehydrogenase/methenyltetrahydrofolate cyclohydrolase FolD [Clostridia bacterium]
MAAIIDGKAISAAIREEIKAEVCEYVKEHGRAPSLTVIIVGEDPASQIYVRNKQRACEQAGIISDVIRLPEQTDEDELLGIISALNDNKDVNGILVQLPLPSHIDEKKVICAISPKKDVDAFGYENLGRILSGDYDFLPCTPAGVMELLRRSGISVSGKNCVVLGRSNIVGKPMAALLMHANGTVTVCHSRTADVASHTKEADIIVAAVGKAGFLTADMIKDGAVIVDVGINRTPDGKLTGDVDFEGCFEKAAAITPVPGGVGPMTITMLLKNTLTAAKKQN